MTTARPALLSLLAMRASAQFESVVNLARNRMCEMKPLGGRVEDCLCDFEVVDDATRTYYGPILKNLTSRSFFRYFKVDLDRKCNFWPDDGMCARRECAVDVCSPEDVPRLWREEDTLRSEWAASQKAEEIPPDFCSQFGGQDGAVDRASDARSWEEAGGEEVWTIQSDDAEGMAYIDLLKNSEKYTGYDGEPARRIWRAIYEENCFHEHQAPPKERLLLAWRKDSSPHFMQRQGSSPGNNDDVCFERRVFYKLISGLQASISTHIATSSTPWLTLADARRWAPRVAFEAVASALSFAPASTEAKDHLPNDVLFVERVGAHSERLQNLYFTYLFVLRAVTRAHKELAAYDFETGDPQDDRATRELVAQLVQVDASKVDCATSAAASAAFDETQLFAPPDDPRMSTLERALARESVEELRSEFVGRFRNISLIMDCVACERCRLWGKLQVLGLGTAIKVLMLDVESSGVGALQRNEVVALVNLLAQLAKSVDSIREWQRRDLRWAVAKTTAIAGALMCGPILGLLLYYYLWGRRKETNKTTKKQ